MQLQRVCEGRKERGKGQDTSSAVVRTFQMPKRSAVVYASTTVLLEPYSAMTINNAAKEVKDICEEISVKSTESIRHWQETYCRQYHYPIVPAESFRHTHSDIDTKNYGHPYRYKESD
jgi:hypothetical protein